MIRHMVFWTLTEEARGEKREAAMTAMKESAERMGRLIPGVYKLEIGENLAGGPHDFVFYGEYESMEKLREFQDHPLHQAHKEMAKDWVTNRACVDYEMDGK
ncbi:Dabb family protein [Anaerolentibacter hominis]|uniref:Dabb family protein n=1 Tax=Anaerolentibacter hominis TaxID=3079009 RepID=UPI0031B83C97